MNPILVRTRHFLAAAAAIAALAAPLSAATGGAMALIPKDAVTVGVIHLDEMRSSPLSAMLFEQTDKVSGNGEGERFLRDAGVQPAKDVDLLVLATSPVTALGSEARVLAVAEGRFDVARITSTIVSRGAVKVATPNGVYYTVPDAKSDDHHDGAVAFLSSKLAVAGSIAAVKQALIDNATGGTSFSTTSGLGREQHRIDAKATAWALVDVARASRLAGGAAHISSSTNGGNGASGIASALKSLSTVAVWATDSGDALKLGAVGVSSDDETRQLLEDTVRGLLSAWRLAAADKSPDLVSVLRKFTVTNGSDTITLSGTIPADTLKMLKSKAVAHANATVSAGTR